MKLKLCLSVFLGIILWGVTAFEAFPSLPSILIHFTIVPIMVALIILAGHWEGRRE